MREVAQVAPAGAPHGGTGRPRVDRLRLSLAFAAFALIGVAAGGAGVLLPAQITDYGVDKTTIGLMFVTFSVGYVAAAAANGALLHRFGVRAYVVVGAAVLSAGAVLSGLRPPFVVLVALQLAIGFGGGALDAALNAYVSTLPREHGAAQLPARVLRRGRADRAVACGRAAGREPRVAGLLPVVCGARGRARRGTPAFGFPG